MMTNGETVLWEQLETKNSTTVCTRAGAGYDPKNSSYTLSCFGEKMRAGLNEKTVGPGPGNDTEIGDRLLTVHREHFIQALLAYLTYAEGNVITGELIGPRDLSGGQIYRQGAHKLPLDRLAMKYRQDEWHVKARVEQLEGYVLDYGDYSFRLFPFPKLPVTVVLWKDDDEFPSRADLFFDTSCRGQFPPDVLWGIATFCVDLFLL